MKPAYQVITREIPSKGIAYLLLKRCKPGQEEAVLTQAAAYALEQGAAQILAACVDPALSLEEGQLGRFHLEHVHDMLVLERDLTETITASGRLALAPLERSRGGMWLALYNAGFFSVPNAATYDTGDLKELLSRGDKCGFALLDGVAVGIYELNLSLAPPEIAGIALHQNFRGRGLGRELLNLLMMELQQAGYARCQLLVSTANQQAWTLYRTAGFRQAAVKSRWYRVLPAQVSERLL